ncbi:MAG TPA: ABC transporter permease [Steroidobacteraceae bacterium]
MTLLTQSLTVARLNIAGLHSRQWSSLVIIIGMACVTGVLVSMLSVTAGLLRELHNSGDPGRAIVLASRDLNELGADLSPALVGTILNAPGIARGADAHAIGDAEVVVNVPPADGFAQGSLNIRGIGPQGFTLRPELRIVAGRRFTTGRQELIVGAAGARTFHFKIGDRIIMPDGEWPIVGIFNGGGAIESQLMADAQTLMASARRSEYGSVLVRLSDPDQFDAFRKWLTTNPTLSVTAERQTDYYTRQGGQGGFFDTMAYLVGVVMSFGALFGAVNILYSSVRARTREIAILRAMGFLPLPLGLSVVIESLALAVLGAILGILLAWLLIDGHESGTSIVFRWSISPNLMGLGVCWAVMLALFGSLFPAIRAARISVAAALRAG